MHFSTLKTINSSCGIINFIIIRSHVIGVHDDITREVKSYSVNMCRPNILTPTVTVNSLNMVAADQKMFCGIEYVVPVAACVIHTIPCKYKMS